MRKKAVIIVVLTTLIIILITVSLVISKDKETEEVKEIEESENTVSYNNTRSFIYGNKGKVTDTEKKKIEYENMPENIKGEKVIGKLEIPSINLETYILSETNDKTLNISVTKLAGPNINEIGNFCITGHNYINSKMFFKLGKVKIDDEIILTNTFDESINYKVYELKEVYPEEVEVLNQDTKEEREVTLITCTFGARKRLIVKAIENYD